MNKEDETDIEKTVDACSVLSKELPSDEEIIQVLLSCLRSIFLPENTVDREKEYHAELLARTSLEFINVLISKGLHEEFQPVAFYTVMAKQKTGGVSHFNLVNKTLGGEPMGNFRLDILAREFDKAYNIWGNKTFGVSLSDEVADIMQKWGDVLPKEPKLH